MLTETSHPNPHPNPHPEPCVNPHPKPVACRPFEIDSHTFWLMEQASSKVGDELVLNLREGAPIRITKAQVGKLHT